MNLYPNNSFIELCPTILYLLAQPATPDSAVTEVIQRVESGEKLKVKHIFLSFYLFIFLFFDVGLELSATVASS